MRMNNGFFFILRITLATSRGNILEMGRGGGGKPCRASQKNPMEAALSVFGVGGGREELLFISQGKNTSVLENIPPDGILKTEKSLSWHTDLQLRLTALVLSEFLLWVLQEKQDFLASLKSISI